MQPKNAQTNTTPTNSHQHPALGSPGENSGGTSMPHLQQRSHSKSLTKMLQ
ncbi:MAG: hypothetical protein FWG55_05775 [Candidatus Bathyarchaeota archaeon]|nr:hypothetical protein [Candidatus Termiticorpusculum sp.]